jgi:hypothetical protein
MTTKGSTQQIDLLFVTAIHETDSISAQKQVMGKMIECEIAETIRCAQSAPKASKTVMDGVLLSRARALVQRVLSASMVAWA